MTKLDHTASGVYAISPTAFNPDGRVDEDSMDRLTDFYFASGCEGITVLGVLGEAPKLDAAEALAVALRVIRRAAGRPIIVGVSAPGFAAMRALARSVMDAGAAGVMIAPPASLKTDEQIFTYFRNAAEAIGPDVPWCLQDYPLSTGVVTAAPVIRRIVTEIASCVMVKHEDWPGLDKVTTLRGYEKDGAMRPISILVGNNALFLDFELERGVDGAMTGYAFPDTLAEIVRLAKAGERDAAHDLYDAHLPMIRYDHQPGVGLAVRKYILMRRGAIASDTQRKPVAAMSALARQEVEYLLARIARHDPRAALG